MQVQSHAGAKNAHATLECDICMRFQFNLANKHYIINRIERSTAQGSTMHIFNYPFLIDVVEFSRIRKCEMDI